MDKKYVCPCGLTCIDCLFFKKDIYETAKKLFNTLKTSQVDIFLKLVQENKGWIGIAKHFGVKSIIFKKYFKSFKDLPIFLKILESIIDLQCKSTCREAGGCSLCGETHKCEALNCINKNGYDGCWQCGEFKTCIKLSFLKMNYGETIDENLMIIKEKGITAVKSRGNKYYAWQRI